MLQQSFHVRYQNGQRDGSAGTLNQPDNIFSKYATSNGNADHFGWPPQTQLHGMTIHAKKSIAISLDVIVSKNFSFKIQ
jgi:hypothetical protein